MGAERVATTIKAPLLGATEGRGDAAAVLGVEHWEQSRAAIESFVTPESIQLPLGAPPKSPRT